MSAEEAEVWIVEDNRALREALAEVIAGADGLRCGLALPDCERFIDALESGMTADVVLTDLGLPGLSGIEGIRRVHGLSPTTRVLVLTIHEDDERVFEAIRAGASGYLLKPLPLEEIVHAVRQVIAGAAPINPFIAQRLLSEFALQLPARAEAIHPGLSPREREILQQLVEGLTLRAIGDRLGLSYHTISNHLRNVYAKLHVRSRSSAIARALRDGLV